MPSELVRGLGGLHAGLTQGVRRQRVVQTFGIGGVTADAGDADELVDLVVVGLEVVVASASHQRRRRVS